MKKLLLALFFTTMFYTGVQADTIINVPIDSRPISCEYLENLAAIGNDICITVDKENMDFFSSYEPDNHLGNSEKVRENVAELVSNHNNNKTTVIINTSSYVTNGLVGSRISSSYDNWQEAIEELKNLATTYSEPKYYVNMPMPRALPETRYNEIWANNESLKGLAWYYKSENSENPYGEELDKYLNVTPTQILMEYGYVANKARELGGYNKLTSWERSFITYFDSHYKTVYPYRKYVEAYESTYANCAKMFSALLELEKADIIDEIVVSNDDLQLPDSITFFASKGEDWIQKEEGSPIKYSFARTYLKIAPGSIEDSIRRSYDNTTLALVNSGRGRNINIINGTDEVPQLIYARDYTGRNGKSASINIINNRMSTNVAAYDVKRFGTITNAAINFSSGLGIKAQKPVDLYIYDYENEGNEAYILNGIRTSLNKGRNVALTELFGSGSISKGNYIFEKLYNQGLLPKLCAYSAWNTHGNAIGLCIAQAQVFSVAQENSTAPRNTAEAQANMLLQHFIEDGVYASRVKRELSNMGYKPNVEDRTEASILREKLNVESSTEILKDSVITVANSDFIIKNIDVNSLSFPWGRTFDILVKSTVNASEVK